MGKVRERTAQKYSLEEGPTTPDDQGPTLRGRKRLGVETPDNTKDYDNKKSTPRSPTSVSEGLSSRLTVAALFRLVVLYGLFGPLVFSAYILWAHSGHMYRLSQFLPHHNSKCLLVVMMSHHNEVEARKWHRERLQDHYQSRDHGASSGGCHVQLKFAVPALHLSSPMELDEENDRHNDIVKLPNTQHPFDPTRAMYEMMGLIQKHSACKATRSFLVITESSYVIHYPRLSEIGNILPTQSTYFGAIVTDFPTPRLEERTKGGYSQSILPPFAFGGFIGLSFDLVSVLLQPMVQRNVMRDDIAYSVPFHDRAIGLAFYRSMENVKNVLLIKGIHHFCSTLRVTCEDFGNWVAFHVDPFNKRASTLEEAYKKLTRCQWVLAIEKLVVWVKSPKAITPNTLRLTSGCTTLSKTGHDFKSTMTKSSPVARKQISEDNTCAEEAYLYTNPEVVPLIQNRTYRSGRDHYVAEGWQHGGNNYFCPDYCDDMKNITECFEKRCNPEAFYRHNYPDIDNAIRAGAVSSGLEHFKVSGINEGRAYNCLRMVHPQGYGTKEDCLDIWRLFINNTESVVKHWPVHGISNNLPAEKCKALMLIDGKGGSWIDFTLRTHRRYLGPDWEFYLIGPPSLTKEWRPKYAGPMTHVVDIPEKFGNLSDYPREVNELYRSQWLWRDTLRCEHILHTHTDVMMMRPGIEDFLNFSYVGAPVDPETYIVPYEWRMLCIRTKKCGGGGGFSIRRKSYILSALKNCSIPFGDPYSEDMWYVGCQQERGEARFMAHPTECNRMSLGNKCIVDDPIGMHHTWMFCGASTCAFAIANSMLFRDIYGENYTPKNACQVGEYVYHHLYNDYNKTPTQNTPNPGWEHYTKTGKDEKRFYPCFDYLPEL